MKTTKGLLTQVTTHLKRMYEPKKTNKQSQTELKQRTKMKKDKNNGINTTK